jgi:hypothetical protein
MSEKRLGELVNLLRPAAEVRERGITCFGFLKWQEVPADKITKTAAASRTVNYI